MAKLLNKVLTERQMTQKDLANETGLSENAIGNFELGSKIETLIRICNALNCTPNDIIGESLTTNFKYELKEFMSYQMRQDLNLKLDLDEQMYLIAIFGDYTYNEDDSIKSQIMNQLYKYKKTGEFLACSNIDINVLIYKIVNLAEKQIYFLYMALVDVHRRPNSNGFLFENSAFKPFYKYAGALCLANGWNVTGVLDEIYEYKHLATRKTIKVNKNGDCDFPIGDLTELHDKYDA